MIKTNTVFLRADGYAQMGLGHLYRQIAFGSMLLNNFRIIYIAKYFSLDIKKQAEAAFDGFIEIPKNFNLDNEIEFINSLITENDCLVLDGYHFDTDYQRQCKKNGNLLLSVDDVFLNKFNSDLVFNHAPGINASDYDIALNTELFLGLEYVILRTEFLAFAKQHSENKTSTPYTTVFICFGGSDKFNLTEKAIAAVLEFSTRFSINVVVGEANLSFEKLENKFGKRINLYKNLDANSMVNLMKDSQIAICPASTISLETLAIGCDLITGYYVDNQIYTYNGLVQFENVIGLENLNDCTTKSIQQALTKLENLKNNSVNNTIIDGKSAERVLDIISKRLKNKSQIYDTIKIGDAEIIHYSKLNLIDLEMILNWRNDSRISKWMVNSNKIELKDHLKFCNRLIDSSERFYWLVKLNNINSGAINLTLDKNNSAELGIFLNPDVIGKGIGKKLMELLVEINFKYLNLNRIELKVHKTNKRAIGLYEKMGFQLENEKNMYLEMYYTINQYHNQLLSKIKNIN